MIHCRYGYYAAGGHAVAIAIGNNKRNTGCGNRCGGDHRSTGGKDDDVLLTHIRGAPNPVTTGGGRTRTRHGKLCTVVECIVLVVITEGRAQIGKCFTSVMDVVEVAIIEVFFARRVTQDADTTCTWRESLRTRVLAANRHRALRVPCCTGARGAHRRNHDTALGDKVHRCAIGNRIALAVCQGHRHRRFIAIHIEAFNGKFFNCQAGTRLGRTARGNGQDS